MSVSALGLALGHLRNAAVGFAARGDVSDESAFLAAECLDLEGLFADVGVVPEVVVSGLSPSESLERASRLLESGRGHVPLGLWSGLQALRARADLHVTYLIYDDHIWRSYRASQGWTRYTHPNGATANPTLRHLDHVHMSSG